MFINQKPHEIEDLVKVSVTSAKVVIVLGDARDPEVADCKVTSTVLAVKSLQQSPPVIAELRLLESVSIVKQLGGNSVVGVAPTPLMDSLMVISTLHPAAGLVVAELLNFQNSSGFMIKNQPTSFKHHRTSHRTSTVAPDLLASKNNVSVVTFGEIRRVMSDSVVMGVVPVRGNIILAPQDHYALSPTDMLLVITKSKTMHKVISSDAAKVVKNGGSGGRIIIEKVEDDEMLMHEGEGIHVNSDGSEVLSLRSPVKEAGGSWRAPIWNKGSKQVIIVLGWRTGLGMAVLLKSFDERLNRGSEVHVLSVTQNR
jgi:hypothetical protein